MRHVAWKQVAWLLTLAGIVRLGAAVYWHQHWHGQFVFGDSQGYFELARAIAHGQPYQLPNGEQVFRTPGYPLLLSPVLWFFSRPPCRVGGAHGKLPVRLADRVGRGLVGTANLWSACRMDCRTDHGDLSRGRGHQRPRAQRSPLLPAGRREPGDVDGGVAEREAWAGDRGAKRPAFHVPRPTLSAPAFSRYLPAEWPARPRSCGRVGSCFCRWPSSAV